MGISGGSAPPGGPAGGALAGSYPSPGLAAQAAATALAYTANYADVAGGFQVGQWYKDLLGFVRVVGVIKKTAAWAKFETIATLPVGARPGSNVGATAYGTDSTAGDAVFNVAILSSGIIEILACSPNIAAPANLSSLYLNFAPFLQVN